MVGTSERKGRQPLSVEGKRKVVNLTLSPEAVRAAKRLCERPVAPLPLSALVEHLIMQAYGIANGDIVP